LGIVEKITSLVWTQRKYEPGEFAMLLSASKENIELLRIGRIVIRSDDESREAAEILYINIKKGVNGAETLEVTGKFLTSIFADRLVPQKEYGAATAAEIMRRVVDENCISAADVARNYPGLVLGGVTVRENEAAVEYANEPYISVLDILTEIAQATENGYTVTVDMENKQYKFNVYGGADRTAGGQSPVIFSIDAGNVTEQEYTQSDESRKTRVWITDESGTLSAVGGGDGFGLKEIYADLSGIKQGEMTVEEYAAALAEQGQIVLAQNAAVINFTSKINPIAGGYKYGSDYFLGDKVTCVNLDWGITVGAYITTTETAYEAGQKNITLTLGNDLPTLSDKMTKRR
jgi:hypothetical protein